MVGAQESKNDTTVFEVFAHAPFDTIPLVKASLMANLNSNSPTLERGMSKYVGKGHGVCFY